MICKSYGYSKSGYYKHLEYVARKLEEDAVILQAVRTIRLRLVKIGTRKIKVLLSNQGIEVGRDRLFKLLSQYNLLSNLIRKRYSYSRNRYRVFVPNLLINKSEIEPGEVIVTDKTYVRTAEGMAYLSLHMDYGSRMILAARLSRSLSAEFCVDGLKEAITKVPADKLRIHHSDHGAQYYSKDYRSVLQRHGIQVSMTGLGKCHDNAAMERLNNTAKNEFGLKYTQHSFQQAQLAVSDMVQIYNQERPHLSLGNKTPNRVYSEAL